MKNSRFIWQQGRIWSFTVEISVRKGILDGLIKWKCSFSNNVTLYHSSRRKRRRFLGHFRLYKVRMSMWGTEEEDLGKKYWREDEEGMKQMSLHLSSSFSSHSSLSWKWWWWWWFEHFFFFYYYFFWYLDTVKKNRCQRIEQMSVWYGETKKILWGLSLVVMI